MQWHTKTLSEFENAIRELFTVISAEYEKGPDHACTLCLHGDLGAGKTTATQVIARELGITEIVNSPTFVIKKIYQTNFQIFKTLIHMDAYRLTSEDNLDIFDLEKDFSAPNTLITIEWPEMIEKIIPSNAFHVKIDQEGEGRSIYLDKQKTA